MKKGKFKETEIGKIPKDWNELKLGDCLKLNYGKGLPERERQNGKIPVYGSNGIVGFHNQKLIKGPGLIIGRKGSVGEIHFSKKDFWPIDTTYYITQEDTDLDLNFLYYKLLTLKINNMNSHAAVPGLNRNDVYQLEISIPSILEQTTIARILSSIDDKIELNNKMNKTLEEIGQVLFKKWFIDEKKKDWKRSTIGKELKTILGGTPDRTNVDYWNGDISWINSGAINDFPIINASEKITELGLNRSATQLMPEKTIVLPFVISVGKNVSISILGIKTAGNQSVLGIIPNERFSSSFIYYYIQNQKNEIYSSVTGGAQQHINKRNVDDTEIIIPDKKILEKFNLIVEPLIDLIIKNAIQNQTLSSIRDSLLPKLMSGEIRVK